MIRSSAPTEMIILPAMLIVTLYLAVRAMILLPILSAVLMAGIASWVRKGRISYLPVVTTIQFLVELGRIPLMVAQAMTPSLNWTVMAPIVTRYLAARGMIQSSAPRVMILLPAMEGMIPSWAGTVMITFTSLRIALMAQIASWGAMVPIPSLLVTLAPTGF